MRTLIVEDDLISRKILTRFMEKYGEVEIAVNGVDALESFLTAHKDNQPYDLICLDIMMPKLDGIRVLKAIRDFESQRHVEDEKKATVIMTTALNDKKTVMEAYDLGCEAYAWKPLDIVKLKEVMISLRLIPEES